MSLHFVYLDDWQAVYDLATGEKIAEGHTIRARDLCEALNLHFSEEYIPGYSDDMIPQQQDNITAWKSTIRDSE